MAELLFVPNSLLRQKAKKLRKVEKEDIEISKKMMKIMIDAPGVGLAANQIGILKQIVTVNFFNHDKQIETKYTLFNPKIISYSKDAIVMEEGCLSFPKQFAEVERSKEIELEFLNEKNELIKKQASGIEARILQHEIDHLSGKLFVDYLSSLKRNIILKKVKKYLKNKDKDE